MLWISALLKLLWITRGVHFPKLFMPKSRGIDLRYEPVWVRKGKKNGPVHWGHAWSIVKVGKGRSLISSMSSYFVVTFSFQRTDMFPKAGVLTWVRRNLRSLWGRGVTTELGLFLTSCLWGAFRMTPDNADPGTFSPSQLLNRSARLWSTSGDSGLP